eukprot:Skav223606  [mRNA]  locus=scaffold1522:5493:7071:- [translate_table: standard]
MPKMDCKDGSSNTQRGLDQQGGGRKASWARQAAGSLRSYGRDGRSFRLKPALNEAVPLDMEPRQHPQNRPNLMDLSVGPHHEERMGVAPWGSMGLMLLLPCHSELRGYIMAAPAIVGLGSSIWSCPGWHPERSEQLQQFHTGQATPGVRIALSKHALLPEIDVKHWLFPSCTEILTSSSCDVLCLRFE